MSVMELEEEDHIYHELGESNEDTSAEYISPAAINDGRAIAVGRCAAVKLVRCLVGLLIVVSVCCLGLAAVLIHQHVSPDTNNKQQSGEWESLFNWTSCSVSCGPGARARVGQCNTNTSNCSGHKIELQPCNLGNCTATRTNSWTCCPVGWTSFQGSCYRIIDILNFTDAEYSYHGCVAYLYKPKASEGRISFALRGKCRELGGYLVHIETSAENTFIGDLVKRSEGYRSYWIGLDDRETEGVWKWTGTDTIANFTDWCFGQPNGGTGANCAGISIMSKAYEWFDFSCSKKRRSLCEIGIETKHIVG